MTRKLTPYEVKELIIEYFTRKWDVRTMARGLSSEALGNMAMLDSEELGSTDHAFTYCDPSLEARLEDGKADIKRELYLDATLQECVKDEETMARVQLLFDEELKAAGLDQHTGPATINTIKVKCLFIAQHRVLKDIPVLQRPNSHNTKIYDFKVILTTLKGGYGDYLITTELFFEYANHFSHFLSALKDATQLSVIPPVEINRHYTYERAHSPDKYHGSRSRSRSTIYNDSSRGSPTGRSREPELALPIPKTRNRDARGYTLDDGPWIYRIAIGNQLQPGQDKNLYDEGSYLEMLQALKIGNEGKMFQDHHLVLIHSQDRNAQKQAERRIADEEWEEEQYKKACERDGIDYDKDVGEPFSKWMKRSLA